jgi:hypothetical protein
MVRAQHRALALPQLKPCPAGPIDIEPGGGCGERRRSPAGTAYHHPMRICRATAPLAVAAVLAAGALTACGSDSSTVAEDPSSSAPPPSGSATPQISPSPSGPACATVWKAGAKLPSPYRGCTTESGWVKSEVYQCEDGHRIVTYAHLYFASPGRNISRAETTLAKDRDFQHTLAVCGA